jgi:hypothetical protein
MKKAAIFGCVSTHENFLRPANSRAASAANCKSWATDLCGVLRLDFRSLIRASVKLSRRHVVRVRHTKLSICGTALLRIRLSSAFLLASVVVEWISDEAQ